MPWWWWVGALTLVGAVGVVKGKRTRRKVWRAVRRYAQKRRKAKAKARAKARTATRQSRARAKARTATRQSRPGRAAARSPWREAQPSEPPRVARRPVVRIQRCSAACRTSHKPASTCDCACGGRDHGRYRTGTAANVRATKYTPAQRAVQRKVTNTARTERWERREAQRIAKAKTPKRGGKG
jgi:hypothetical protein